MNRERTIIHLNVADFAVAVERLVDRRLEKRPLIIAAQNAPRAAVYDMSEEAFRCGVRKNMPLPRAVRRCREACILPPHPDRYKRAMQAMLRQALPFSPLIEPGEDDGHLFVDVTGTRRLFGPPMDIAWRLRRQIRTDLALDPIWSVAPNKLVAKVATRLVKPSGEYIVASGEEEAVLAPLPLALVPGLEGGDLMRLQQFNLTRAGQVAALPLGQLEIPFGLRARHIYETVRGIDPSPVRPLGGQAPTVGADRTLGQDTNHPANLEAVLYELAEQAGRQLRQQRLAARCLDVTIDYSDGQRSRRRAQVRPATAEDPALFAGARRAFRRAWQRRVRVRHLRLTCDRLIFPPAQQALFTEQRQRQFRHTSLITAIDRIRERFGSQVLRMGRTLAA